MSPRGSVSGFRKAPTRASYRPVCCRIGRFVCKSVCNRLRPTAAAWSTRGRGVGSREVIASLGRRALDPGVAWARPPRRMANEVAAFSRYAGGAQRALRNWPSTRGSRSARRPRSEMPPRTCSTWAAAPILNAGYRPVAVVARYTRHSPGTPLRVRSPLSWKVSSEPTTTSLTVWDTKTSAGPAADAIRAPIETAIPLGFPSISPPPRCEGRPASAARPRA